MITVAFELDMPGKASWNGRWSGEGRCYARVRKFTKEQEEQYNIAEKLGKKFFYTWSDGWCASVLMRKVDAKEANQIRKKSVGFSGYDWMISSILKNGYIAVDKTNDC